MPGILLMAAGAGAVAGMRTVMMPALLGRGVRARRGRRSRPAALLGSPMAVRALSLAAAGELVVDKLPMTPPRTDAPSLAARMLAGALAAGTLASLRRGSSIPAAAVGALAALGSAHLMLWARQAAGRRLGVPDPVVGLAEDGVAIALGRRVMEQSL